MKVGHQRSNQMPDYTDIERTAHQEEEELKWYKTIYESVPCICFILDSAGKIESVNQFGAQQLGYTTCELIKKPIFNILEKEEREKLQRALTGTDESLMQLANSEFRLLCRDGSVLWSRLSICGLPRADGSRVFILFCKDITEIKQIEGRLREREKQFQIVIDSLAGKVAYVDSQTRYQYVSKQYGEWSKVSTEEILGQTIKGFMGASAYRRVQKYVEAVLTGKKVTYEITWNFDDGSERYLIVNYIPDSNGLGKVLGFFSVMQDLTEFKKAEEILQQFNADLERQVQQRTLELEQALEKEKELGELKSRIISTISHEYRTPLTTIQSSAELLERYYQKLSEEKRLTHLHRIQVSTKHLTDLVNDVLFVGKAEAGSVEFNPAPLCLEQFSLELVEQMCSNAQNQTAITFSSRGNCTNASVDEKLLRQILINLLTNAIKYSPGGKTVRFDLECFEEVVTLRIQDCGIGIPAEDLPRLFESFHRASNVGTIPGTGLGLAIVKKCVDLHGGQITVNSIVGEGTTFTVTLPLSPQ